MWRRFLYWQGSFGYPRMTTINYVEVTTGVLTTLENTMLEYTSATIVQIAEGVVTNTGLTPGEPEAYPSVKQFARLNCFDESGNAFSIVLPAPKFPAFAADIVTLRSDVLAALSDAAALSQVLSPIGYPFASMYSGVLNGPAYPGFTNS